MKNRLRAFVLGAAVIFMTSTADAQQASDPTAPEQDRSGAVASQDSSRDRTFVDAAREWAKDTQIIERLQGTIDGWYPRLGGMTRGSGFALGPGYRTHILGGTVLLDASAGLSTRLYKAVDLHVRWLRTWNDRAELWTDYRFEDFPQEDFYGMGPDTVETTRTNYAFRGSDVVLRGELTPIRWLRTGVALGYATPSISPGRDREWPSVEQSFTDVAVPGLASQPDFLHAQVFTEVDYRDVPDNPTLGGMYHAAFGIWNDRTANLYDFRRFDATAAQYLPITPDRKHIVSGRLGTSFVNNAPGSRVPFYYLPYIGGADTVRSFRDFRFRDENALWFGAEYRWIPITWVSGVLFADFGTVSHDWQNLTANLKPGYGFGARVHSRKRTFAKLDFGFGGGEGWRTILKFGF